jgi:hypothetical protein
MPGYGCGSGQIHPGVTCANPYIYKPDENIHAYTCLNYVYSRIHQFRVACNYTFIASNTVQAAIDLLEELGSPGHNSKTCKLRNQLRFGCNRLLAFATPYH